MGRYITMNVEVDKVAQARLAEIEEDIRNDYHNLKSEINGELPF
jgi:hypothetical protein